MERKILFWLNKDVYYICDEIEQPTDKAYYTTIKVKPTDTVETLFNKARNNLCKQLYKTTGVWWQYIHFSIKDLNFKVLEETT